MGHVSRSRYRGTLGWFHIPPAARAKKSAVTETYLRVFLHGDQGRIAWGWHTAAELTAWKVRQDEAGAWTLTGTAGRVDPFYLRQTQPTLLFTAPKVAGPPWCWPVQEVTWQGAALRAKLGPVEF